MGKQSLRKLIYKGISIVGTLLLIVPFFTYWIEYRSSGGVTRQTYSYFYANLYEKGGETIKIANILFIIGLSLAVLMMILQIIYYFKPSEVLSNIIKLMALGVITFTALALVLNLLYCGSKSVTNKVRLLPSVGAYIMFVAGLMSGIFALLEQYHEYTKPKKPNLPF